MADFTQMAFDPETGLCDRDVYPSTPASEAEARENVQGINNQLRNYINDTLIAQMENADTGASGAERIGSAAISGVTGTTVRSQIADIKTQLDGLTAGVVSDGSITTAKLAPDAVNGTKIADDAIDSEHYAALSIDTEHLSADCVTGAKIADDAIDSEHYAALSIDAEHIAAEAVSETKIGTGAVTVTKIAAGAVTAAKLGTIQSITLDTGDTVTYDATNNKLMLNVSGCSAVQLAPMIFGTSTTPPSGTYPAGTLYFCYIQ